MKTVLVTGSTGFIGSHLVNFLSEQKKYRIIGAVEDSMGITDRYQCNEYLTTISNDAILNADIDNVDVVVNCAFSRSSDANQLASAIDFTAKLSTAMKKIGITSLINISSQGVYKRLKSYELQTEISEIEPIDMYSMAKFSAEQILNVSECAKYITNVRLASINMKQRFLFAFVKKIISGDKIILTTPNQYAALLDVKDVVSGLQSLIDLDDLKRKNIYNLGIGSQYTILEYAQVVVETLKKYGYSGKIIVKESESEVVNSGMDCTQIMKDTDWRPIVTIEDMVIQYFYELTKGESRI